MEAVPPSQKAGARELRRGAAAGAGGAQPLTTLDAARGWVFSPSIQGQNVLAWAADLEAHRPRIAALMKGISAWDKNALDMCGKWPLALKAAACGMSPERLFIDAAQSTGVAGADDGLFCSRSGQAPRLVPFEARAHRRGGRQAGATPSLVAR